MDLNEYQNKAMATCLPTCDNVSYMLMNLVGEVGELASKIAKDIRKGNVVIGRGIDNDLVPLMPFDEWMDRQEEYKKEAGDILWTYRNNQPCGDSPHDEGTDGVGYIGICCDPR